MTKPRHFVSESCKGERCLMPGNEATERCNGDAHHKVGEEIMHDDPSPIRHNCTAYVCCSHYRMIFGPYAAKDCE